MNSDLSELFSDMNFTLMKGSCEADNCMPEVCHLVIIGQPEVLQPSSWTLLEISSQASSLQLEAC